MSRISRQIIIGALIFVILTSGCGELTLVSPTPVWTIPPAGQPILPTTTIVADTPTASTSMAVTPLIPLTGENVVSLQCQFCVDEETHAVLIFPDFAYFDVSSDAPVSCLTANVTGGKRILICHGTQSRTFTLNICSDPENCLQFPVTLQPCPLLQTDATPLETGTSFYLTPINTLKAPTKPEERTQPAATALPSETTTPGEVSTSTPAVNTPTSALPTATLPAPTSTPGSPPTDLSPVSYTDSSLAELGQ